MMSFDEAPWLLPLLAVGVLLLIWFIYRRFIANRSRLDKALAEISFENIEGLIIPNADDGEIQIDQLLLTSQGLLILEIKDAQGTVFGSDKMQDWAVISDERRYTFSNPQPALYDRIAAVRHIVRQVPVAGRILFLDGAEFTKGVPEAFRPYWELIQKAAEQRSELHSPS
jgi:hypothetical protein